MYAVAFWFSIAVANVRHFSFSGPPIATQMLVSVMTRPAFGRLLAPIGTKVFHLGEVWVVALCFRQYRLQGRDDLHRLDRVNVHLRGSHPLGEGALEVIDGKFDCPPELWNAVAVNEGLEVVIIGRGRDGADERWCHVDAVAVRLDQQLEGLGGEVLGFVAVTGD